MRRLRILPLTMTGIFLLLAIKVADVARGGEQVARAMFIGPAAAESEAAKPAEKKDEKKPDAKKEEKPAEKSASSSSGGAAAASSSSSGAAGEAKKEGDKKTEAPDGKKGHVSDVRPGADEEEGGGKGLEPGAHYFSPTELFALENLTKRHAELDEWEKGLEIKENLLGSVEKRVDEKVVQMEDMQKELKTLISQYNDQEDAKIKSLVKIYENMKPRDAARIFDEVEMPILLLVIDKMSEKKAAPILAAMDSKKAKQLTVNLAQQRQAQGTQFGTVCANTAPVSAVPPAPPPPASR